MMDVMTDKEFYIVDNPINSSLKKKKAKETFNYESKSKVEKSTNHNVNNKILKKDTITQNHSKLPIKDSENVEYRIIEPYQNIGSIIDSNKPIFHKRGNQRFLLLSNHFSFLTYNLEKLKIEKFSPPFSHKINSYAFYKENIIVSVDNELFNFNKIHLVSKYENENEILRICTYDKLVLFQDKLGFLVFLDAYSFIPIKKLDLKIDLFINPTGYLNKIVFSPLESFYNDIGNEINLNESKKLGFCKDMNEKEITCLSKKHNIILYNINSEKLIHSDLLNPTDMFDEFLSSNNYKITVFEESPIINVIAIGFEIISKDAINGCIICFNLKYFKSLKMFKCASKINSLSFSDCESLKIPLLISSEHNGNVNIWDLEREFIIYSFPTSILGNCSIDSVLFIPNEPLVILTSNEGNFIKQFYFSEENDFSIPKLLKERVGFVKTPKKIRFYGPDETHILAISDDQIKMVSTIKENLSRDFSLKKLLLKNVNLNFYDFDSNYYRELDWSNVVVLNKSNNTIEYNNLSSGKIPLLFNSDNKNFNSEYAKNYLSGIDELKEGTARDGKSKKEDQMNLPITKFNKPKIKNISSSLDYPEKKEIDTYDFLSEKFSRTYSFRNILEKINNMNFINNDEYATSTCISYCGNYGFTSYSKGLIVKYGMQSGVIKKISSHDQFIKEIKSDGLNSIIITISDNKLVWWDFVTLDKVHEESFSNILTKVEIEKSKELICVAMNNNDVIIFNKTNFRKIRQYNLKQYNSSTITDVCFGNNGDWLIIAFKLNQIIIIDLISSIMIENMIFSKSPLSVSVSSNNIYFAVTFEGDKFISLFLNRDKYLDITNYSSIEKSFAIKPLRIQKSNFQMEIKRLPITNEKDKEKNENEFPNDIIKVNTNNSKFLELSDQYKGKYRQLVHFELLNKISKAFVLKKEKTPAPFFLFDINNDDNTIDKTDLKSKKKALENRLNNPNLSNSEKIDNMSININKDNTSLSNAKSLNNMLLKLKDEKTNVNNTTITNFLKMLSPEKIDFEIRTLSIVVDENDSLISFIENFLLPELETEKNFEFLQSLLNRYLKIYTTYLIEQGILNNENFKKCLLRAREICHKYETRLNNLFRSNNCLISNITGIKLV